MTRRIFTFHNKVIGGPNGSGLLSMDIPVLPEPAAMTLRFDFSDKAYSPVDAGVGGTGTWTKLTHPFNNIWDWTNTSTNWAGIFKGAFPDVDNEVRIIAAGDTSTVTSFANLFSGLYESDPQSTSYKLLSRNNVVSCVPIDVSGAANGINRMFIASALREYVPLNLNDLGTTTSLFGVFADTLIEEIPEVDFGHVTFTSNVVLAYFARCSKLRSVGAIKNCENLANTNAMFNHCVNLESLGTIDSLGAAQSLKAMFQRCEKLASDITINAPLATDCGGMFNMCRMVEKINVTVGSPLTCNSMFASCHNLREIKGLDRVPVTADISRLFYRCNALPRFPALNYAAVTNCNYFAQDCYAMYGYDTGTVYDTLSKKAETVTDHVDAFKNCGISTAYGVEYLERIPLDWGGFYANIWIDFGFSDPDYDPSAHQLGVGRGVTGEDKYNQASKNFTATWVRKSITENTWRWCVTSGTNLSNAFVVGDGTGSGVPMLSNGTIISGIPADLTAVEGGTLESLQAQAQSWLAGHEIDPEDYVPTCHIVKWDLNNATSITSFIGTNRWFNNCLEGTLPDLVSSNLGNISYAFDRCWNITSAGDVWAPACTSGENAYYSMVGLTEIATVSAFGYGSAANMFRGCVNATKESIELSYYTFNKHSLRTTTNCYKLCGILVTSASLDNVPVAWGGNMAATSDIVFGSVRMNPATVDYTNGDMEDLTDQYDEYDPIYNPIPPSSETMQYFVKDGTVYYNARAIKYIHDNIETLYPGWHLPTAEESQEIGDVALYNPYGSDPQYTYVDEQNWASLLNVMASCNICYVKPWNNDPYYEADSDTYDYPVVQDGVLCYTYVYTLYQYYEPAEYTLDMDCGEFFPIYLIRNA